MIEWFNSLTPFVQIISVFATIATIIMVVQIIMILIGAGLDNDIDADIPDDVGDFDFFDVFGLKLLTVRNIIAFFAIGGWSCVALFSVTESYVWSVIVGVLAGLVTMFLFSLGMRAMMRLQNDGTMNLNNAIGKDGTVYLIVPANKQGSGKVNFVLQESLVECEAITDEDTDILTGEQIVICDVVNNCVVVKRK